MMSDPPTNSPSTYKLRDRRPVGVDLDLLPDEVVAEDVAGLEVRADGVEDLHGHVTEAALGKIFVPFMKSMTCDSRVDGVFGGRADGVRRRRRPYYLDNITLLSFTKESIFASAASSGAPRIACLGCRATCGATKAWTAESTQATRRSCILIFSAGSGAQHLHSCGEIVLTAYQLLKRLANGLAIQFEAAQLASVRH